MAQAPEAVAAAPAAAQAMDVTEDAAGADAIRLWIVEMRSRDHIRPDPDSWFELVGVRGSNNGTLIDGRLGALLRVTNMPLFQHYFLDNGCEKDGGGRNRFRNHVARALDVEEDEFKCQLRTRGDPRGRPVPGGSERKHDFMLGWRVTYG